MLPTRALRVVLLAAVVVIAACDDTTRPKATIPNVQLSFPLYALTGSPPAAANAINFFGGPRRADASFQFDVAFDLDAQGKVLVYPVRAIAGALAGQLNTRVGLQTVSGSFEALRSAPEAGYDTLAVRTISPGNVVAVELVDQVSGACFYSFGGQSMYAKFVVDSVNLAARRLHVRWVTDANCGYRSLVPDSIPTF